MVNIIDPHDELHRDLSAENRVSSSSVYLIIVLYSLKCREWIMADFGLMSKGTTDRAVPIEF